MMPVRLLHLRARGKMQCGVPVCEARGAYIGDDPVEWVAQHRDIVKGAARLGVHPPLLLHPCYVAPFHDGAIQVRPTHVNPFGASHSRALRCDETVCIQVAVLLATLLVTHLLVVLQFVCQPAHRGATRLVEVRVHDRSATACLGLLVWWKRLLHRAREAAASPDGLAAQPLYLVLLLLRVRDKNLRRQRF